MAPTSTTTYVYNSDRQLDYVTRPGDQVVDSDYDSAGRLHFLTLPGGETHDYEYYSTSEPSPGKLKSITILSSGVPASTLDLGYDGFLPTTETWSGPDLATMPVT